MSVYGGLIDGLTDPGNGRGSTGINWGCALMPGHFVGQSTTYDNDTREPEPYVSAPQRETRLPADSLRHILRAGTSALHHQLDNAVGEFDSRRSYADYVQKTHRFRAAIEAELGSEDEAEWNVDPVADLAANDLGDLGVATLADARFSMSNLTQASRLGALYVLEGSSLGARLLLRRAESLGLSADFGARHLAQQASDHQRWRSFLDQLESVPAELQDHALSAAESVFAFALSIYTETVNECT